MGDRKRTLLVSGGWKVERLGLKVAGYGSEARWKQERWYIVFSVWW